MFQEYQKLQEQLLALPVALLIGVVVLFLAIDGLVLWMAGCLRNADQLTYLRALLLVTLERILIVPASYGVGYVLAIVFGAGGIANVSPGVVITIAVLLALLLDLVLLVALLRGGASVHLG